MQPFDSIDRLEQASSLDPAVNALSAALKKVVRPQALRDLLHGVPIGHSLHAVLVQVPIGTWASAAILDLVPKTGPAAALLIGTGLVSAVPAAAAGSTDWSEQHPEQQRVGLVHAVANWTGIGLYAASLVARKNGNYGKGKLLSYAGLTSIGLGGVLGGHMSYHQAAGANHVEHIPHVVSPGWHDLGPLEDLPDGTAVRRMLGEAPVFVLRRGRQVRAMADNCSHLSGPLHEGEVTGDGSEACVSCPWHGSVFRLSDGHVVHGPATAPQPVFEVRVVVDRVEVRLPNAG